jgi:hypothetical protein
MEGRIRVIVHQAQQTHAEDMSELGITKPTSKGRELIRPDAEAEEKAEESPYIREGHFRLMDLPAELRVYIYEYLLPYNMDIRFEVKMGDSWLGQYSATRHLALTDPPEWRVEVTSKQPKRKPEPVPEPVRGPRGMRFARFSQWPPQNHPVGATSNKTSNGLQTQLFLVNKAVSTEAKCKTVPSPCRGNNVDIHSCPLWLQHLSLHNQQHCPSPCLTSIAPDLRTLWRTGPPSSTSQPPQHLH